MSNKKYQIVKRWDDYFAEYRYHLQVENNYSTGWDDLDYDGNEDWAERQKEHYNCEIVEEKTDET